MFTTSPVEAADLLSFLVLETSYCTKDQFKAFKSLQAYNQMVSGFITSVQGHIIANKHVIEAKPKVRRHTQRMNDAPVILWIVTEKDDTIICAHCVGCMAGLWECCSHIASVLHRSLDKIAWKVGMYSGKMYLAVTNLCERNFICSCGRY